MCLSTTKSEIFFSVTKLELRILLPYLCPLPTLERRGGREQRESQTESRLCSGDALSKVAGTEWSVRKPDSSRGQTRVRIRKLGLRPKLKFKVTPQTTLCKTIIRLIYIPNCT